MCVCVLHDVCVLLTVRTRYHGGLKKSTSCLVPSRFISGQVEIRRIWRHILDMAEVAKWDIKLQ